MEKTKKKKRVSPIAIALGVILVLYTIVLLYLLFWGVLTSVKTNKDFSTYKNYGGLPLDENTRKILSPFKWEWKNYATIIKFFDLDNLQRNGRAIIVPFGMQVVYTFAFAVGCSLIGTLAPCLVAYATSKFNYKFNRVIEIVVIITMIVPVVGSQVSMISLLHSLNIYDTFLGLYLQKFYFANMYYLVFSAVFKGVSKEYYEAAHIDGASELTVMVKIAFPLVLTSFALTMLLYFIQYWNDYSTLLIYAPSHPTISYGLYRIMTDSTGSTERGSTPVQMAGCVLIVLPVIILFIIFRNKLMGNFTIGGVKE